VPVDIPGGPAKETKNWAPAPAACSNFVTSSNVPSMTVTLTLLAISLGSLWGLRTSRVSWCPCCNAEKQNSIPDRPKGER
jgi:hypothetical protein